MDELLINFGDPEDVLRAIPRAEDLLRHAEEEASVADMEASRAQDLAHHAQMRLAKALSEIQRWQAVLHSLQQLSAITDSVEIAPDNADGGNSTDRALRTVTAINGPTNIAEVAEHMTGFSSKTVSWALWKLADEGAIQRLGHGRYAPLGYKPGHPTTNYLKLPPGLPTPSSEQISQAAEAARAAARARRSAGEHQS